MTKINLKYIIIFFLSVFLISCGRHIADRENENAAGIKEEPKDQYRLGVTFEGSQSQIIDMIQGKATYEFRHLGDSRFVVKIMKPDGSFVVPIVDVTGNYNGVHSFMVPETGAYILDVKTDGTWSFMKK